MQRLSVESECLRSVGFNAHKGDLEVEFQSGEIYLYMGVPAAAYLGLMNAASKDAYYETQIKNIYVSRQLK